MPTTGEIMAEFIRNRDAVTEKTPAQRGEEAVNKIGDAFDALRTKHGLSFGIKSGWGDDYDLCGTTLSRGPDVMIYTSGDVMLNGIEIEKPTFDEKIDEAIKLSIKQISREFKLSPRPAKSKALKNNS